jgi:PIN domain nuclease of toxin-antitoxin system
VKLLLDTHILLWAATAPERLGSAEQLVRDAELRLLSAASAWELAIKQGLGKVDLGMPVGAWMERALRELLANPLDITVDHAAAVEQLPGHHRDPFDRLLVVQAQQEGAVLLTADRVLLSYGSAVRLVGRRT